MYYNNVLYFTVILKVFFLFMSKKFRFNIHLHDIIYIKQVIAFQCLHVDYLNTFKIIIKVAIIVEYFQEHLNLNPELGEVTENKSTNIMILLFLLLLKL